LPCFPPLSHSHVLPALSTLSLHDALPISRIAIFSRDQLGLDNCAPRNFPIGPRCDHFIRAIREDELQLCHRSAGRKPPTISAWIDRKSTRLNSSHEWISYAVFCLKKKKKK